MDKRTLINLLHIVVIAPLAIYLGYKGYVDEPVEKAWDLTLFLIAIFGFIYHFFKMINPPEPVTLNMFRIINIFHLIIFTPIAVYVTANQYYDQEVPKIFYNLLIILGIWALLYNVYVMVKTYQSNAGRTTSGTPVLVSQPKSPPK